MNDYDEYANYAIIYHDTAKCDSKIIKVCNTRQEALEQASIIIKDDPFITKDWHKIEYNDDTWSVYQLGYIFKKSLIGKYCIRPFFV